MAEKDLTSKDVKDADAMTERGPGARDMGGKDNLNLTPDRSSSPSGGGVPQEQGGRGATQLPADQPGRGPHPSQLPAERDPRREPEGPLRAGLAAPPEATAPLPRPEVRIRLANGEDIPLPREGGSLARGDNVMLISGREPGVIVKVARVHEREGGEPDLDLETFTPTYQELSKVPAASRGEGATDRWEWIPEGAPGAQAADQRGRREHRAEDRQGQEERERSKASR